jgi:hypothetical protein
MITGAARIAEGPAAKAGGASLRVRSFDPLLILWVLLAAALLFLVINPLFRLVQTSLQDADTGDFTLDELRRRLLPPALHHRDGELAEARGERHRPVPAVCRADRLGGVAH